MRPTTHSTTGLLLSGGIDSTVLLDQLLQRGTQVVPFYVETGCAWSECERNAVDRIHEAAATIHDGLEELVLLEMPLGDLYGGHWSISGENVPDDTTADDAVFMPGHNPLLLLKPALWCQMHGVGQLALASLANNPFDDATPEFFSAFEEMLGSAMPERVQIIRPFAHLSKKCVVQLGRHLPLELTFSCLSPAGGLHCGRCNKCAERRLAFAEIGRDDPTQYAAGPSAQAAASAASHFTRR
jgi:7-cyano-7-deazaguanine synthase